jgi:uncharacterized protein
VIAGLPVAVTAIPLGVAFGIILERAGLGDPRVIHGQMRGTDFTVVTVMFACIVVAMLGVAWLGAAGLIDPTTIAMPPTDAPAQVLGALIFGAGFGIAALCPGTACVAASSGRRDGLAAVAGMLIGTALTAAVWPLVGLSAAAAPREGATLAGDLHVPLWVVVCAVTAFWMVAEMIARRVRDGVHGRWWQPRTPEIVTLTLALAFPLASRGAVTPATVGTIATEIARERDHVDPLDLAEWIRAGKTGLRVIDVREGVDSSAYVIPGAETMPLGRLGELQVAPDDDLVLYSDGGTHAAQAWVLLRARGLHNVRVLKDGLAAWEDEVLSPSPPAVQDDSAQARFKRARALSQWFGGHPLLEPRDATRSRRRKTC